MEPPPTIMSDMKGQFRGWYPMSPHERGALSRYATFSLDANVLLNLYRLPLEARSAFLDILRQLRKRGRLWLSHQAAIEYQRVRPSKVLEQLRPSSLIRGHIQKALQGIEKEVQDVDDHPFIDRKLLLESIRRFRNEVTGDLQKREEEFSERLYHDPVREELDDLFNGAVGPPDPEERLEKIYAEGRTRYKSKIPPGYADSKENGGDKDEPDCYGDLVLWKQLLDYAEATGRPIVLVTDDRKKGDWFWKADPKDKNSRLLGPRPELVEEMYDCTGKRFHVTSSARFVKWMSKYLKRKVSKQAIAELESEPPVAFRDVLSAIDYMNSNIFRNMAEPVRQVQELMAEILAPFESVRQVQELMAEILVRLSSLQLPSIPYPFVPRTSSTESDEEEVDLEGTDAGEPTG